MQVDILEFVSSLETVHVVEDGGSLWIETTQNGDGAISIQVDDKFYVRIAQTREQLERIHKMLRRRLFGFE